MSCYERPPKRTLEVRWAINRVKWSFIDFSCSCPVCWGPREPLHHPDRSSAHGRVCAVVCVMFCESMMDGLAGGRGARHCVHLRFRPVWVFFFFKSGPRQKDATLAYAAIKVCASGDGLLGGPWSTYCTVFSLLHCASLLQSNRRAWRPCLVHSIRRAWRPRLLHLIQWARRPRLLCVTSIGKYVMMTNQNWSRVH